MDVKELVGLAHGILEGEKSPEETLLLLEQYSEAFNRWIEEGGNASLDDPAMAESARDLEKAHKAVVEKAKAFKEETALGVRNLKRRAAGIMKYIDVLPKRFGSTRGKSC